MTNIKSNKKDFIKLNPGEARSKMIKVNITEEGNNRNRLIGRLKETLTRMGVDGPIDDGGVPIMNQTCYVYEYNDAIYISHFKLMYALEKGVCSVGDNDIKRQMLIAKLLLEWNLISSIDGYKPEEINDISRGVTLKVVPFKDKRKYILKPMYIKGYNPSEVKS